MWTDIQTANELQVVTIAHSESLAQVELKMIDLTFL